MKSYGKYGANFASLFMMVMVCLGLACTQAHGQEVNTLPPGWHQMGTGTKDDHQQGIAAGNFTYTMGPELITSFSHSNIGIFHHIRGLKRWNTSILHSRFEPASFLEDFERENPQNRRWQISGWQRDAEPNCPSIDYASMFFNSDDSILGETLVSPPLDLTAQSMPMLKLFWWNPTGGDYIEVDISADGGSNYESLGTLELTNERLKKVYFDLSAYNDINNVLIRFTGRTGLGSGGTFPHIDNFTIVSNYSYTWPVKAITKGDMDGDGLLEIVSGFDQIIYPPVHLGQGYWEPYPGAIYIDWNPEAGFTANPLVWGAWGEALTSTKIANTIPLVLSDNFRPDGSGDILVATMVTYPTDTNSFDARVFILEQPVDGWEAADYRSGGGGEPYENEPDYVNRLWVEEGNDDSEFFWNSNEIGPNTVSYGITACEMILPGEPNSGILVTRSYDTDGLSTCRISLYKRIAPKGDHKYRFTEIEQFLIDDFTGSGPVPADLDGDPDNGKESFILKGSVIEEGDLRSTLKIYTLEPVDPNKLGEEYELISWYVEEANCMAYECPYSNAIVLDRNRDGFDDFVVKLVQERGWTDAKEDVLYFQNTAQENSRFNGARFAWSPGWYEKLIDDDSVELRLDMADADGDRIEELITGLTRRDPPDDPNGKYKTIYYNIFEEDFRPETFPGDFDRDYDVDYADFALLANHWLCKLPEQCWDTLYDISYEANDRIDFADLKTMLADWLEKIDIEKDIHLSDGSTQRCSLRP
jgi:hypothetical protein